ncbi:hypothetical protein N1851_017231 [Merluccius polli]|uniref:Uncharacterized protein n=1 Tax=Merluccius polli TaxID=89951 RepID=A0AA47NZ83_MERPO|nr:hypothetical protein N1851_017231 [Merluccius polli]
MRGGSSSLCRCFCGVSSSSTSTTGIAATQANATSPAGTSAAIDRQTVLPSQFQTSSLRAEVLWCLNTAAKHNSYNSNEGIGAGFASMFTDSQIASSFACGKDKTAYMIGFGIAPHFKKLLTNSVNDSGPFVLMFDESLNQSLKKKQMDIHVRFWKDDRVTSSYFGSQFLGHARAEDLLESIKECVAKLNLRHLLSVSMDGPNVNLKMMKLLQNEHSELYGDAQLISVGSCGLHILHNAMKAGFTTWQVDKLLRDMHYIFHNVPARREDYTSTTGSSTFPPTFLWVENVPVTERAVDIWPMLLTYIDAVQKKKLPNPNTASYDNILAARDDELIIPKLQFFFFHPFLTKYQTDEPVLPFLAKDLKELLIVRIVITVELLSSFEWFTVTICEKGTFTGPKLPANDHNSERISLKNVDIGLGAETAIKALQSKRGSKIGELSVLAFRRECLQCLVRIVGKLQDKSPLKVPVVRQIACLDPTRIHQEPEWCIKQMKSVVQTFLQGKKLAGGIPAGDVIIQQFASLTSVEGRDERFLAFKPMKDRLDVFLHTTLSTPYPDLLQFCKSLLLLSHGQATVERGFSVNKEVETCNLHDRSLNCGGVLKVPLTKELLASASSARSQYRLYLENERKNKESATHALKRKAVEEELLDHRTQRDVLSRVCESLGNDADKLAEQAEGKAGSKMAELYHQVQHTSHKAKRKKRTPPIGGKD